MKIKKIVALFLLILMFFSDIWKMSFAETSCENSIDTIRLNIQNSEEYLKSNKTTVID